MQYYKLISDELTGEQVDVIIWSEIEAYVAVICACIITLRALLLKYFTGVFAESGARETRSDSTLPSWRVRRGSKLAVSFGYTNNIVELSSRDNLPSKGKYGENNEQKVENRRIGAGPKTRESLEIEEIMV